MHNFSPISRRAAIKSSVFGLLAVSVPSIVYSEKMTLIPDLNDRKDLFHRYPSIDDEIVSEMVGVSHFNLDRVKELVNHRSELARATWDWGFGDWESAIGAATHVGRKDIVEFLMNHGARPNIFTYTMLGAFETVKSMIEVTPGVQRIAGPHGISLLQHAKIGERSKYNSELQKNGCSQLVKYLEELGDADVQESYQEMKEEDKEKYLGDYMYGEGPNDGFSIKLNMRGLLSLGKLGKFGGALYMVAENEFVYNGIRSVKISFSVINQKVNSLTIYEPDFTITAKKV